MGTAVHTLDSLPFSNHFAALPEAFHTRLAPSGLPNPWLISHNPPVARLLDLDPQCFNDPRVAEYFSGNQALPGSAPLAAVYSGHQFGVWAGQLGDGRAHLLGGIGEGSGHYEIQLKGAGQTPYSRGADGRAVLRSSIREYLCSEAMAALGIPSSRALCLVGSDLPVYRESIERAAVVTRIAPSFIRFGSFEHWAASQRTNELRQLADHVITHFRPECRTEAQPYLALLGDIARRTAELIAQWMTVGFMHGVMNTDNMSILGLTLDYGPFGFMESFDAAHICNHSDQQGRYSYRNQPAVAQWNLHRLAEAFMPLTGSIKENRAAIDDHFGPVFEQHFAALMRAKLGLRDAREEDIDFFGDTFAFLQQHKPDFTLFFRGLSSLPATVDRGEQSKTDAIVRDQFIERSACDHWLAQWRQRLAQTPWPDEQRQASMKASNPKYILRNWLAENAIQQAQGGNYSVLEELLHCLQSPFSEQAEYAHFAALPPEWARHLEVSCSS